MGQLTKEERRERLRNTRNETRARQRAESIHQQIEDIDLGVGFSSAKTLARYFGTTDKTIWVWAADQANSFPQSRKLGPNMTRWSNAEIKAYREAKLSGESNG